MDEKEYWEDRREKWKKRSSDNRGSFLVDFGRIIHSKALRRLQGKTQVYNIGDSDFYRNRLTHSLEVSQIALGVRNELRKSDNIGREIKDAIPPELLIQCICMLHDIGHPPFGHAGEVSLNYCMWGHGGFEGNAQTLRITTELERYSKNAGMNLTRRTLLGILKYPIKYSEANENRTDSSKKVSNGKYFLDSEKLTPPKCYYDSDSDNIRWILEGLEESDAKLFASLEPGYEGKYSKSKYKSFDCSIMDVADDISNAAHDLEDAIAHHFINLEKFEDRKLETSFEPLINHLSQRYPKEKKHWENFKKGLFSGDDSTRKRQISRLIGYFIPNVEVCVQNFQSEYLKYKAQLNRESFEINKFIKNIIKEIYSDNKIQHFSFKGQNLIIDVFDAFSHAPEKLLPKNTYRKYEKSGGSKRVICDHIAGMTDRYLYHLHNRLFAPQKGTIFDYL